MKPIAGLGSLLLLLAASARPAAGDDAPPPCDPHGNARAWLAATRDTLGLEVRTTTTPLRWYPADKEIVVSWHNWFPLDGTRRTLCGRFVRFEPFVPPLGITGERDWNVYVIPDAPFADLIGDVLPFVESKNPQMHECCPVAKEPCPVKRVACMEAEVTPVSERFREPGAALPEPVPEGAPLPAVCAHGPWVREVAHGSRPEIHPAEVIWFSPAKDLVRVTIARDLSDRFADESRFWFGDDEEEVEPGWRPWVEATSPAHVRLAVLVPPGESRTFLVHSLAPAPAAPDSVVLQRTVGTETVTARSDVPLSLEPVCRDAAGLHAFLLLDAGGDEPYRTLEIGPDRALSAPAPRAMLPPSRTLAIRPVRGTWKQAANETTLTCDADVVVALGSSKPDVVPGQRCAPISEPMPDVVCRFHDVPVLDGLDAAVKMTDGSTFRARVPRMLLRVRIIEETEPKPGMSMRTFDALPYFAGDREDSPFAELLNDEIAACWDGPAKCHVALGFTFQWHIEAHESEQRDLGISRGELQYTLTGKIPLTLLARNDRYLRVNASLDGPRYARPYRGSRIPTDDDTRAFRIRENPTPSAVNLFRAALQTAGLSAERAFAIQVLSDSAFDESLLGRRARMLRYAARQSVALGRHVGIPRDLRELATLVAKAASAASP